MGAHVGASPAHATGRAQPLAFRAAVAQPGHFGIELDPRRMDEAERAELAEWIAFPRQHGVPLPPLWRQAQDFNGSWLAHAGLPLPPLGAESVAIFHVSVKP